MFVHEDYPCCGCEPGDCDGSLYGSDESIRARVERDWREGHGYCEHEAGIYNCDEECGGEEHECIDCDHKPDGWECRWCGRFCPADAHKETIQPNMDISERWYPR